MAAILAADLCNEAHILIASLQMLSVNKVLSRPKLYEYDVIEEFNVDSEAESGQLNLAHVARNNASVHLVRSRFKICEGRQDKTRQIYFTKGP